MSDRPPDQVPANPPPPGETAQFLQISPDGKYGWNGSAWLPIPAPVAAPGYFPPPAPAYQAPPGQYQPPAGYAPGATGQMPPPIMPAAVAAAGGAALMYQFGGAAAWSIGFGLVSIVVPFFANFYFPILPIIGLINAVRAIQRGRMIGGVVGIVLNLLGGVVTLFASGLLGG